MSIVSNTAIALRTTALSLICTSLSSCFATKSNQTQTQFEIEDETKLEGTESNKVNTSAHKSTSNNIKIKHPKKASAWHTRKEIMVNLQPSPGSIFECKETLESAASEAFNLRSLDEASLSIQNKVEQEFKTYHWCFYQIMADLDLRMERDLPLMTEKKDLFLSRMRVLWVLARSLDAASEYEETTYMIYLRKRYMALSQHEFGRNLEIIDKGSLQITSGNRGKSAHEFSDP